MTIPALESALAKLRECADMTMFVEVNHDEAAALLNCFQTLSGQVHYLMKDQAAKAAKIEAADRLADAVASELFTVSSGVRNALAAYRNPQPAGGGE